MGTMILSVVSAGAIAFMVYFLVAICRDRSGRRCEVRYLTTTRPRPPLRIISQQSLPLAPPASALRLHIELEEEGVMLRRSNS